MEIYGYIYIYIYWIFGELIFGFWTFVNSFSDFWFFGFPNRPKSSQIVQNRPKSSKIVQNRSKSSKIVQNRPKTSKIVQKVDHRKPRQGSAGVVDMQICRCWSQIDFFKLICDVWDNFVSIWLDFGSRHTRATRRICPWSWNQK